MKNHQCLIYWALDIYTHEFAKETFNANYAKSHKQLARCRAPIRMCYIEELGTE